MFCFFLHSFSFVSVLQSYPADSTGYSVTYQTDYYCNLESRHMKSDDKAFTFAIIDLKLAQASQSVLGYVRLAYYNLCRNLFGEFYDKSNPFKQTSVSFEID